MIRPLDDALSYEQQLQLADLIQAHLESGAGFFEIGLVFEKGQLAWLRESQMRRSAGRGVPPLPVQAAAPAGKRRHA